MRGSVIGSLLIHVGIVAILLIVRTSAPIVIPGPDVVQVALLEPDFVAPPVAVSPPVPRPQVPEVAPEPDEGVKLEKPKPAKREKPEETPPPVTPTVRAAALPYAAVGPPGLKGEVSIDAADFEFTYYLMLVRNRIATNWTPPTGGSQGVRAVVYFKIARNGSITSLRVEQSSTIDFFDRAALRSVQLSDPLPPLPLGFAGGDLGVHFGFEYTGP